MHYSKATIVVPFLIIMIALFMKFSGMVKPHGSAFIAPLITTSQQATQAQRKSTIKLNLTGPFVCKYADEDIKVESFIKNKQIYGAYTQDHVTSYNLVKGDCYYSWKNSERTGKKVCGISHYLSIAETMMSMSLLSTQSLFSSLGNMSDTSGIDKSKVQSIAESCKKMAFEDNIFTVPPLITFVEMKVTPGAQNPAGL